MCVTVIDHKREKERERREERNSTRQLVQTSPLASTVLQGQRIKGTRRSIKYFSNESGIAARKKKK
jgi:hypothetical protein